MRKVEAGLWADENWRSTFFSIVRVVSWGFCKHSGPKVTEIQTKGQFSGGFPTVSPEHGAFLSLPTKIRQKYSTVKMEALLKTLAKRWTIWFTKNIDIRVHDLFLSLKRQKNVSLDPKYDKNPYWTWFCLQYENKSSTLGKIWVRIPSNKRSNILHSGLKLWHKTRRAAKSAKNCSQFDAGSINVAKNHAEVLEYLNNFMRIYCDGMFMDISLHLVLFFKVFNPYFQKFWVNFWWKSLESSHVFHFFAAIMPVTLNCGR